MSFDALHPREEASGRFTDRLRPESAVVLDHSPGDTAAAARRVFADADGIEITGGDTGPEGVFVSVYFEDGSYTVSMADGVLDVTDADGETVDPAPVLDALTGGDPDSAGDAMTELAEVSGSPAASIFGSELEEDAASCGHVLAFDASSGTASTYSMVRKYTAGVHFHEDGSITRSINGHTVPVFGPTYGRAAELERWASQNTGRIQEAQNAALSAR